MADEPKNDLPNEAAPVVFVDDPNKPRSPKMDLTLEECEELIDGLTEKNQMLEKANENLEQGLKKERVRITNDPIGLAEKVLALQNTNDDLADANDKKSLVIEVLGVSAMVLVVVLVSMWAGVYLREDYHRTTINKLTKELEMTRGMQTEAVATNTEESAPQIKVEPLTSIYIDRATLLKAEPAGEYWPIIIQLNDGRKMRVFVNPKIHYKAMGNTKFGYIPMHNFPIMDYCLIDPTWHDPDGDLIEEPLFKFSLDDYGPKRKPKRAEY